ncbi:MAG: arginine--tRNA ligase [Candidatus Sungbacteria bacterium GWC2_49_10]|uniref:Arginine--tRNA ligase n=2 Tax=Parcubacteria group TaxID=1794811 RepID=A0A0G1WPY8_9BACT|nr:MAG: Arginine-tRNA ligase [Parcubacteria group bacterium GW2011_GWB1_50_9]KKW20923.1 MAG: arginyl-tRNA synthetase, arginyl-tRNA synthetase [Candidatus Adlerbacteria bacterium GW2011_GWC1_50_9]OGZ92984.1 MAG: arginine--tRNA ligase [Candidatus Sungbacteria bacterium GWC2_49_10]
MRNEIEALIRDAASGLYGSETVPPFSVVPPDDPAHGDYASNVALSISKIVKRSPMEIAKEITAQLKSRGFSNSDIASPGFINIFIPEEALRSEMKKILTEKEGYGQSSEKKGNIQVEFISANPTGPLTLGNGRGGFYGDVLSNVLAHQGYSVEREYYVNDAGNQVRTLGLSVKAILGVVPDDESYYHGAHIEEWVAGHEKLVEEMPDAEELGKNVARDFLARFIKPAVEKKMNIRFDRWTSEDNDVRENGYVDKVMEIFRARNLVYEGDGATWLKTTEFGDDKDRVLITSDGYPTYFFVDAAHHLETRERGISHKINILGADHHGYVSRIKAVADILGYEKVEWIVMQLVRLVSGGKEVRISKRKGTFVTIDELIEEVGVDAARYFFLERAPETHMDFDLDLARERSVKNPVYYVQYAHARMCSLSEKAGVPLQAGAPSAGSFELLKSPDEFSLIKKLIQFLEVVEDIAKDYHVHRLPRYAYELARAFHNFYEKERIIGEDTKLTSARLALVQAAQIVLRNTLNLMGISAPEKM